MKVKIFTTSTCPYCQMLKEFLQEKGVDYQEAMVDQDESAKEEMKEVSEGFLGVPFTLITNDDGSQQKIIGFDQAKFEELFG